MKWEYRVETFKGANATPEKLQKVLSETLTAWGQDGWEAIFFREHSRFVTVVAKREVGTLGGFKDPKPTGNFALKK